MPQWWAEHAWLGGPACVPGVVLDAKDGRLAAVSSSPTGPPPGATVLPGLTLPGLANAHSHAFHRALRGRTHQGPGDFWTWRQLMYTVAARLDPDSYFRLARAAYAEMVLAGFTAVGEFHYLHHPPGGGRYDDPNQMSTVLMAAAADAGIRLTLLDVCYLAGGFDRPVEGTQLRFGDGSAAAWSERVSALPDPDPARVVVGAAIHSVRAVPPDDLAVVAEWAATSGAGPRPLHAHVSEQRREHTESVHRFGATPLALLGNAGALGPHFTAVHGTHLSAGDIGLLAAAGGACCLCPTTERDLGDGIGPAPALQAAGVTLCVGSDSHAVVDGLEELRALEMDARLVTERRGLMEPAALLSAATAGGIASLGWDAGRLEAGGLADFVTLSLASRRTAGADPTSPATAVFCASAADVETVVIGGRTVVSRGVHADVPDVEGELAASIASLWL